MLGIPSPPIASLRVYEYTDNLYLLPLPGLFILKSQDGFGVRFGLCSGNQVGTNKSHQTVKLRKQFKLDFFIAVFESLLS